MVAGTLRMKGAWNHNTHYHRLVLANLPANAERVLDVGCGEGHLLAELVDVVPEVVGIDADAAVLDLARAAAPTAALVNGDFLTQPFEPASFDLVAAIASLHHMDLGAALRRMNDLLRPGGAGVVVGLAQPRSALDYAVETGGVVASQVMRRIVGMKPVKAPTVWPPPHSYAECRRVGAELLPHARFRRRLYFRYSLEWTRT